MKNPVTIFFLFSIVFHLIIGCDVSASNQSEQPQDTTQTPDLQRATDLISRQQWDQAIKLLKNITSDYPGNGEAWYYLAYAHHSKKEFAEAIEANKKAIQLGGKTKANAWYNLACSYAVSNDHVNAELALKDAIANGFINFDLLKNDPEIEPLRKKGLIKFPKEQNYSQIKARNGILIKYHLILPKNYDRSKAYPAMLAYPPGDQQQTSADWAVANFWGETAAEKGWIIIVPVAPDRGWINHPAHHALNDLLREVKTKYKIEGGKFHMVGFESGARPAATFALMSKEYFQSLTTVSSHAWERWDNDDLDGFTIMPVKLIVGENDEHGLQVANYVERNFKKYKVRSDLEIIEGEGRDVPSIRNARLIDLIEEFVR